MSELDKLELYLITAGYKHYERIDREELFVSRHQIIVYDENGKKLWDAMCHKGSYGYGYTVVGWLTADDVIERIERDNE